NSSDTMMSSSCSRYSALSRAGRPGTEPVRSHAVGVSRAPPGHRASWPPRAEDGPEESRCPAGMMGDPRSHNDVHQMHINDVKIIGDFGAPDRCSLEINRLRGFLCAW